MNAGTIIERLEWGADVTPARVLAAWPASRPLAVLWSGTRRETASSPSPWSRWTILAGVSGVRAVMPPTSEPPGISGGQSPSLAALDEWVLSTAIAPGDRPKTHLPFVGGWLGMISYEVGRELEPSARRRDLRPGEEAWPRVLWQRCPSAYVFDHLQHAWYRVGRIDAGADGVKHDPFVFLPDESELAASDAGVDSVSGSREGDLFSVRVEAPSIEDERAYTASATRLVEYIHAGDVFQANLAHQLRAEFSGSARAFMREMFDRAGPWFGGYLEDHTSPSARRAMVSVSPELFLSINQDTRTITTRPIKGTRPARTDADDLRQSPKDRAELNMIIDLMRNDLGRVCEWGSIRVVEDRAIERHGGASESELALGGVHHGVATITGRLRENTSVVDVLRCTFPGGSITGAPKVRAMQIIEELEPEARGPYTGCIGYISDCGSAAFNIAIRTACIQGGIGDDLDGIANGSLRFGVGAGIVADSDPASEWRETMDKAAVLLRSTAATPHNDAHTRVEGRP